jgi:hypothetical protein
MKTLSDFIGSIEWKDIEGNRTYLSANFEGVKYGQSYQNTVNTKEDMINAFAVFYYQLYQSNL